MGGAAAFSALVLAVSFPFSALLSQHRDLSAASAQLTSLQHENRQLLVQEKQLSSKTEIERRARQDYQLVRPGQTLYALLPGPGSTSRRSGANASASGAATAGDPGDQALVPPSRAADLAPDPGLPATAPSPPTGRSGSAGHSGGRSAGPTANSVQPAAPSTFLSRVVHTLEFWN